MRTEELVMEPISEQLLQGFNIIYGAGYNGKLLYARLTEQKVQVNAFYDDDMSRWGETYCGCKILSKKEFDEKDDKSTNIIISSMYVGRILNNLSSVQNANIFSVVNFLLQKDTRDFQFFKYKDDFQYLNMVDQLEKSFGDGLSQKYYQILKKTVKEGRALADICDLCCGEPQYFIKEIRERINGVNIIDAGAYTGDTVCEMTASGICPGAIYSFEADADNFKRLLSCRAKYSNLNWVCENKALWNKNTFLGMKFMNYNARIDTESTSKKIEAVTIDDYFADIDIGFIKMDIEGAEQKALGGG